VWWRGRSSEPPSHRTAPTCSSRMARGRRSRHPTPASGEGSARLTSIELQEGSARACVRGMIRIDFGPLWLFHMVIMVRIVDQERTRVQGFTLSSLPQGSSRRKSDGAASLLGR
jgi:hypothetical protein